MRLTAALFAWLSLGLCCSIAQAVATVSIDQAPILHVLRQSDVPGAKNQELPSGALSAGQFVLSNNSTHAAARAEEEALLDAGFRSSAISEFTMPGNLVLKSTVAEFGSDDRAARLVTTIVRLSKASQMPPGARGAAGPDTRVPRARLLTFTPSQIGGAGGFELITSAHHSVYTLRGIGKPDHVSLAMLERLLRTILSRG